MPMQSVLDIMPLELFELILNTNRVVDPTDYRHLRLLCRLANEVLEPHVFLTLTIRHNEHRIVTKADKLAAIASSASPYSRSAKTIAFQKTDPDILDGYGEDNDDGDNDLGHLGHGGDAVAQLLLDALKSLKGVEEVSMTDLLPQGIRDDVLRVLADYPFLKRIELIPGQDGRAVPQPILDRFSNIRFITITQLDATIDPLCVAGAIARSPAMECLKIRWRPSTRSVLTVFNADRWWLGSLFRARTSSPGFNPKFKSLVLDSPWITLNPGVAPSLASLTRFWFGSMAEVSPAFWVAMAASSVRLESLRAGTELDMGLVRYLTSYEGLQELHVYFGSRIESAEDESLNASLAEGFFTQAVLRHKNSLRILKCDGEYGPWSCETWLPQILLCTLLKELAILSHYPSPLGEHAHRTMPVGELISKIVDQLPHIARLSIKATRRMVAETPAESLNIYRLREYFAAVCMTEAIITATEPPRWVVSTPIAQFNPVPGPIHGQYKLRMDPECAQFLQPPFYDPDNTPVDGTAV